MIYRVIFCIVFLCSFVFQNIDSSYIVGAGIHDVTGPSVEINFMGYAVPSQRGSGIHLRLRSRAFVFEDPVTGQLVCYVSVDGGMASDMVKMRVLEMLQEKYGGEVFFDENVAISGTHSHSGPGGYLAYVLYQTTSLGFVEETAIPCCNAFMACCCWATPSAIFMIDI